MRKVKTAKLRSEIRNHLQTRGRRPSFEPHRGKFAASPRDTARGRSPRILNTPLRKLTFVAPPALSVPRVPGARPRERASPSDKEEQDILFGPGPDVYSLAMFLHSPLGNPSRIFSLFPVLSGEYTEIAFHCRDKLQLAPTAFDPRAPWKLRNWIRRVM